MNRREFILGATASAGIGSLRLTKQDKPVRPNILVFLIDDMGWGDLRCYGSNFHSTPNIDQLAKEGIQFTNAYAAAPVCSPSRAGLLTGQAPARILLTQWLPGTTYPNKKLIEAPTPDHLNRDLPTLAERLHAAGYKTGAVGKWHLGGTHFLPTDFGFDVNVAGGEAGHPPSYFGPFNFPNLQGGTPRDYLTDVLTERAEQFLATVRPDQPFFLYMAEYAVHIPVQAKQAMIEKYRLLNGGKDEPDPVYAAMIESADIALGALRNALKRKGVADNTIIVLTSDNGGVGFQYRDLHRIADNGGLRSGKGYLYEGGIRVPLIVHWPGVASPGTQCNVPVTGLDLMPTLLSAANIDRRGALEDGLDIGTLLHSGEAPARDTLYWHYPHYSDQGGTPTGAIRQNEWKLIEFFEDMHVELYNLALDPGEQYDFSSSFADKAEQMRRKLHSWRERVGAVMPTANPRFNQKLAGLRSGPPGCSWQNVPDCRED